MIVDAAYSEKMDSGKVKCLLCPFECLLTEGKIGICQSRYNENGVLKTDNFGELVSACYDPIEKKPLYHFYPGTNIFSTGANGCNFKCNNCQNWEISQTKVNTQFVAPDDLVILAGKQNSIGVAYTYTEPLIWFEYIKAAGQKVKKAGMKNVLVTNGYINSEPLDELLPIIDAANIDLKSMEPSFYKKICKAKLEPVLKNIEKFHKAGVNIEITNLVIPELNDSDADFSVLTDFIAGISTKIPLHFSAYFPHFKMNKNATPVSALLKAYEIATAKLEYVYLGNVRLADKSNTYCPECKMKLISRTGYSITIEALKDGKCANCGYKTGIIQNS